MTFPISFKNQLIYLSKTKNYLVFNVTRKGYEFIANKLTGQKSTEFTARYVNTDKLSHVIENMNISA